VVLPRNVSDLCRLVQDGESVDFLMFWGHRPRRDGRIGPACLSQWWPSAFVVDGVSYPTAEHFMMAQKARMFGDEPAAAAVLEASTPADAKASGRRVKGYDDEAWTSGRYEIVVEGNTAKFGQNRDLVLWTRSGALVSPRTTPGLVGHVSGGGRISWASL
jgi:ribA/ribD-fused uncharacterized protein